MLSNAVSVGAGVVFDVSDVALRTDRSIKLTWDPAPGFAKNELTARCEGPVRTHCPQPVPHHRGRPRRLTFGVNVTPAR